MRIDLEILVENKTNAAAESADDCPMGWAGFLEKAGGAEKQLGLVLYAEKTRPSIGENADEFYMSRMRAWGGGNVGSAEAAAELWKIVRWMSWMNGPSAGKLKKLAENKAGFEMDSRNLSLHPAEGPGGIWFCLSEDAGRAGALIACVGVGSGFLDKALSMADAMADRLGMGAGVDVGESELSRLAPEAARNLGWAVCENSRIMAESGGAGKRKPRSL